MGVETKKAVLGGIEKWDRIIDGTGVDEGRYNCELCHLFGGVDWKCKGCPFDCGEGTSYQKWIKHKRKKHDEESIIKVHCPECRELAIAVRDDLKKLLTLEAE